MNERISEILLMLNTLKLYYFLHEAAIQHYSPLNNWEPPPKKKH